MEERWIGIMTEYPKTRNAVLYEEKCLKKWNRNKLIRSISNIVGAQRIGEP